MYGSITKLPSKNLVVQRCAEGFNSGVKGQNPIFMAFYGENLILRPTIYGTSLRENGARFTAILYRKHKTQSRWHDVVMGVSDVCVRYFGDGSK
jgi:hypothetical protein